MGRAGAGRATYPTSPRGVCPSSRSLLSGGGACPAESCRECVAKGCGWAPGMACQNKGMFGFGKEVSTAVTQCTPLRDALVRLRDTSPQASETLVAAYDFIRDKITLK